MKNIIYVRCENNFLDMLNDNLINSDGIMVDTDKLMVNLKETKITLNEYLEMLQNVKKLIIINIIYVADSNDSFEQNINKINNYVSNILKVTENYSNYQLAFSSTNIQVVYALQSKLVNNIGYFIDYELNFVDVDFYIIPITRLDINVINELLLQKKKIIFFIVSALENEQLKEFLEKNFSINQIENFYLIKCY